jgi:hypothetical protein
MKPAGKIALQVHNDDRQHFTVVFGRPGHVEIMVTESGNVVAEIYDGPAGRTAKEPLARYDGGLEENFGYSE